MNGIRRFFDFLGNMGLLARDDPPKSIDMTGREWGAPVDGLTLSVREVMKQDPDELVSVSVVLRNGGPEKTALVVPGWLFFYVLHVTAPDGSAEALSPYGAQLLKPERKTEELDIVLAPGDATETPLPLGSLFGMRARGNYRVSVECLLPGGKTLRSNEASIRI